MCGRHFPGWRDAANEAPATLGELAHAYLEARPGGDALLAAAVEQIRASAGHAARLRWLLRGTEYQNTPAPVQRRSVEARVGSRCHKDPGAVSNVVWNTSPSEIEEYLKCPFRHFAKHDLRLDTQQGPRPLKWDLGSIAHDVLANAVRRAIAGESALRELPPEQWREFLTAAVREYEAGLSDHLDEQRPDLAFLRRTMFAHLQETLEAHVQRWGRGDFAPVLCEQRFGADGDDGARPPIVVRLNGDVVHVRGQIDRIDICEAGGRKLALIYDYKSGVARSARWRASI